MASASACSSRRVASPTTTVSGGCANRTRNPSAESVTRSAGPGSAAACARSQANSRTAAAIPPAGGATAATGAPSRAGASCRPGTRRCGRSRASSPAAPSRTPSAVTRKGPSSASITPQGEGGSTRTCRACGNRRRRWARRTSGSSSRPSRQGRRSVVKRLRPSSGARRCRTVGRSAPGTSSRRTSRSRNRSVSRMACSAAYASRPPSATPAGTDNSCNSTRMRPRRRTTGRLCTRRRNSGGRPAFTTGGSPGRVPRRPDAAPARASTR